MRRINIKRMILIALFAALMVVGAYIRIPNPFFPVYFTFQGVFCAFAGLLMGSKSGAASVILYIAMGLLGLPVFSSPPAGPQYVLQPTFGFLLGFAAAAYIMGRISESAVEYTVGKALLASFCGLTTIFIIGINYMYLINIIYINSQISYWVLVCGMSMYFLKDLILFILVGVTSVQIRRQVFAYTYHAFDTKK